MLPDRVGIDVGDLLGECGVRCDARVQRAVRCTNRCTHGGTPLGTFDDLLGRLLELTDSESANSCLPDFVNLAPLGIGAVVPEADLFPAEFPGNGDIDIFCCHDLETASNRRGCMRMGDCQNAPGILSECFWQIL